jgi:hypothetical protein
VLAALGVVVAMVALAGCINYDQDLTLNKDGSGFIKIHYNSAAQSMPGKEKEGEANVSMSAAPKLPFAEADIKKGYEGAPVTIRDVKVEELENIPNATYFIDFKNITDLNGKGIFAVEGDKIRQTFALDKAGGNYVFKQLVNIKMDVEDPSSLSAYKFTYVLNCPGDVVETNGKAEGKVVKWEYTLDKLVNKETAMTVTYKTGGGFPVMIVVLIVIVIIIVIVVIIIIAALAKKKKKAPASAATPPPTP